MQPLRLHTRAHKSVTSRTPSSLEQRGYQLGKTIGVGAYAKVKLGVHTPTGRQYAIKIISRRKAPDGYIAKFLPREVKAIRSVCHPHVMKLHEIIEDADRFSLVTELAAGGDLLEYINTRGPLADPEAKRIFRQLVCAIDHCHSRGVIHRDLKCENILLSKELNVKVGDFGFARKITDPSMLLSTHCGSYAYAAPEILMNRPYTGPEIDIWSLGIILYAIVAGRLPFNDKDVATLLREIQRGVSVPRRMSSTCADLLKSILVMKTTNRLTTRQILEHPWLRQDSTRRHTVGETMLPNLSKSAVSKETTPVSSSPPSSANSRPSTKSGSKTTSTSKPALPKKAGTKSSTPPSSTPSAPTEVGDDGGDTRSPSAWLTLRQRKGGSERPSKPQHQPKRSSNHRGGGGGGGDMGITGVKKPQTNTPSSSVPSSSPSKTATSSSKTAGQSQSRTNKVAASLASRVRKLRTPRSQRKEQEEASPNHQAKSLPNIH